MDAHLQTELVRHIRTWSQELGFTEVGFSNTSLEEAGERLDDWLKAGYHGEMDYMARHGTKRSRPAELVPGTRTVITVRMDYMSPDTNPDTVLASDRNAYVSRYALGRDYHKVIRRRLARLWDRIDAWLTEQGEPDHHGRVFTDSAPVLEKALAQQSGLGWIGKNTLLLSRTAGSWFFLGEIFTDLDLPNESAPPGNHCGSCSACIDVCPTDAIVAPYQLDARRCISYLTIEKRGEIPVEFRRAMGNRIFGCDDCQLVCPWNKFANITKEGDFAPRHGLDQTQLLSLFAWTEDEFLKNTEGSAIRRTGYDGWLRNIAVALGNGPADPAVLTNLRKCKGEVNDMVAEHIDWAINELEARAG